MSSRKLRNGKAVNHQPELLGRSGRNIMRKPQKRRLERQNGPMTRSFLEGNPPRDPPTNIHEIVPPAPMKRKHTRSMEITCSSYGLDRKIRFPGYFFCSECDWYDEKVTAFGKEFVRTSRYKCTANHHSPLAPTQIGRTPKYLQFLASIGDDLVEGTGIYEPSVVLSVEEENSLGEVVHPPQQMASSVASSNSSMASVNNDRPVPAAAGGGQASFNIDLRQLQVLEKDNHRLRLKIAALTAKPARKKIDTTIRELAAQLLEKVDHRTTGGKKQERLFSAFLDEVWESKYFQEAAINRVKQYMRANIFSPFKVTRIMDLDGAGKINFPAIEALRQLEKEVAGAPKGSHYQTVLPSAYEIGCMMVKLNRIGQEEVPFGLSRSPTSGGEIGEFESEAVLRHLAKATILDPVTTEADPIILAQAADGSRFSPQVGFVMAGFKICDRRARNPWTKQPIEMMQSRNLQIPTRIDIGPENDEKYKEMRDFFDRATGIRTFNHVGPNASVTVDSSSICTDMKASWKLLGRGGPAKVSTSFCHLCSLTSAFAVTPNRVRCNRCASKPSTWECYHQPFLVTSLVAGKKREMNEMIQDRPHLAHIDTLREESFVSHNLDELNDANRNNERSIHFDISCATIEVRMRYREQVLKDLATRSIDPPPQDNLTRLQETLKKELESELLFVSLRDQVEHGSKGVEEALFGIEHNPPCILHMNMRVCIKMLTTVMRKGLSSAMKGRLDGRLFAGEELTQMRGGRPSVTARYERYKSKLEALCNNSIFGDAEFPTNWRAPFDDKEHVLLPLSLDNDRCMKAVQKAELIVGLCLINDDQADDRPSDVINYFDLFCATMALVGKREVFSQDDIDLFQSKADEFSQQYIKLEGMEGMTNYIHMLAAGHVSNFLQFHGSLYPFSNQGWEALNSLVKTYFHRRTGRGGGRNGARSRLLTIMRWLQRRLVYMTLTSKEDLETRLESMSGAIEEEDIVTTFDSNNWALV